MTLQRENKLCFNNNDKFSLNQKCESKFFVLIMKEGESLNLNLTIEPNEIGLTIDPEPDPTQD